MSSDDDIDEIYDNNNKLTQKNEQNLDLISQNNELHDSVATNEKYESMRPEIIDRLEKLSGKITEEHNQTRERLEHENELLREKIKEYEKSVPFATYAGLFSGLLLIAAGLYIRDLIFTVTGISVLAVAFSAIFESKYRGERVR